MSWSGLSKFPHPANIETSPNLLFFHYQLLFTALRGIKLENTSQQEQQIILCQIEVDSCRVVLLV